MRVPIIEPIDYLVLRKYPRAGWRSGEGAKDIWPLIGDTQEPDHVRAYRTELAALPAEELQSRYLEAKALDDKARQEAAAKQDAQRFYNQPWAMADADHWSRASYWSLDEAVALSFGRDPRSVTKAKLGEMKNYSPFVGEYFSRSDLVERAKWAEQLSARVFPAAFIAWADRLDIAFDPKVRQAVIDRGQIVGDWKTLFEQMKAAREQDAESLQQIIIAKDNRIAALERTVAAHKERADIATATQSEAMAALDLLRSASAKDVGTRERDSLLKIVIGLAIGGYRYDPLAKRGQAVPEIVSDLERAGVAVGADTVRKYLAEAAALLPPEDDEGGR